MQILRFGLAGVVAAGVLGAGVAGAATMHPVLGRQARGDGRARRRQLPVERLEGAALLDVRRDDGRRHQRVDPRQRRDARREAGLELQGEELRRRSDEGARDDRGEARLLPRLGRHEGAHGRAARDDVRGHGPHRSGTWRDDADAGTERSAARSSWARCVGGVSALYWGKAGWSKLSAALSPVESADPAHPLGRLADLHGLGLDAALRSADLAARAGRAGRAADVDHLQGAARAAEGRAGLDLPLRHRLDGEERALGRGPAQRRAARSRGRSPRRTRSSSSRPRSRTSTT